MAQTARATSTMTITLLVINYIVLAFVIWKQNQSMMDSNWVNMSYMRALGDSVVAAASYGQRGAGNHPSSSTDFTGWDPSNPLAIPKGQAVALPSIRVEKSNVDQKRRIYGGNGDKAHLGGFTEFDSDGVSPTVWKNMITELGVKSVLDVGCGRGTSTTWFLYHGMRVLCAEGSHDAVEKTFLPDPATQVTEHDFSRGPWWPKDTYDAVWAVEFLEHVGVNYHFNYISAFRKAALLFVTSSRWGGWHHVEVHDDEWWVQKYESYGFRYSQSLTQEVRKWARSEKGIGPDGKQLRAQHIKLSVKVFINPVVASLPEHAHLFPELGCYVKRGEDGKLVHRECGTNVGGGQAEVESKLPDSFRPLTLTDEMDEKWMTMLKSKIDTSKIG